MKTVLFAWELGGGFGHIASMRRYARRLHAHGFRLVAAVRHAKLARTLTEFGVEVLQAPPWPEASFTAKQYAATSSATLGDSLASAGLADAEAMDGILRRWTEIFQTHKPDLVVADYAPAAALIARNQVPLLLVGNGYTVPPSEMTHFPLLHRSHAPVWDELRLLTILNKVVRRHGIAPLEKLPKIFSADDHVVETFPLLDPYDLQRNARVDGPAFDVAPIARRENANDILVYLAPGYAIRNDIVRALIPFGNRVRIHARDLSWLQRGRLMLSGARVQDAQLDLVGALSSAKLAVHFGGSGLGAHAIAAGVPQLVFSTHIEQELNGLALERAGIGKLVRSHDPDVMISHNMISDALNDSALASHAAQSGALHRDLLRDTDPLAAFEARSLALLRHTSARAPYNEVA